MASRIRSLGGISASHRVQDFEAAPAGQRLRAPHTLSADPPKRPGYWRASGIAQSSGRLRRQGKEAATHQTLKEVQLSRQTSLNDSAAMRRKPAVGP